jgi:hypothetical protein
MSALRECVHTGVCSPGAVNAHRLPQNALKRLLQVILNRIAMSLALPPGELRAIVCNNQLQPSRHYDLQIHA